MLVDFGSWGMNVIRALTALSNAKFLDGRKIATLESTSSGVGKLLNVSNWILHSYPTQILTVIIL